MEFKAQQIAAFVGGTIEGNEEAMIECTEEIDDFLKTHHGP